MNPLGVVIASTLAASFVIYCGIKLFDMGSELAEPIRKYGAFLGIIFAFVTIFNFLLPDMSEVMKDILIAPTILSSALIFMILGYIASFAREKIVGTKKHSAKQERISKKTTLSVGAIDVVEGLVKGVMVGFSFLMSTGTGIMTLCALILFEVVAQVERISLYQKARFSRRQNIIIVSASLIAIPLAAILSFLFSYKNYLHLGSLIAVAAGFFACLSLGHLLKLVAKVRQKR